MASMNVSLPDQLKQYVEEQVRNGYSTPSEYVRELIRTDQKQRAKERLDAMLLDGLNSGDSIPADAAFWADLRRDAVRRLESRRPPSVKSNQKRAPRR